MRRPKNEEPLIMIADHDKDERGLLRAMLKLKGVIVIEAADGQAAIELAIDKSPDLMVVDLMLPRVSGSVAIRRIRKRAGMKDLPIVAISLRHPLPIGRRSPNEMTVVIDRDGTVRDLIEGIVYSDEFDQKVKPLLFAKN